MARKTTNPDNIVTLTGKVEVHNRSAVGKTVTAAVETHILTAAAHGFSDGDSVFLSSTGALPAGLKPWTEYFVVGASTTTFQVSATSGGTAVAFTDAGSGTMTVKVGLKDIGEASKFSLTPSVSTKTMNTSRDPARGVVKEVVDKTEIKVDCEFKEYDMDNIAVSLGGSLSTDGKRVSLMRVPIAEFYVRVTGTNDDGIRLNWIVPRLSVKPSKATDLLTEDFWSGGFEGSVLAATEPEFADSPYGYAEEAA